MGLLKVVNLSVKCSLLAVCSKSFYNMRQWVVTISTAGKEIHQGVERKRSEEKDSDAPQREEG